MKRRRIRHPAAALQTIVCAGVVLAASIALDDYRFLAAWSLAGWLFLLRSPRSERLCLWLFHPAYLRLQRGTTWIHERMVGERFPSRLVQHLSRSPDGWVAFWCLILASAAFVTGCVVISLWAVLSRAIATLFTLCRHPLRTFRRIPTNWHRVATRERLFSTIEFVPRHLMLMRLARINHPRDVYIPTPPFGDLRWSSLGREIFNGTSARAAVRLGVVWAISFAALLVFVAVPAGPVVIPHPGEPPSAEDIQDVRDALASASATLSSAGVAKVDADKLIDDEVFDAVVWTLWRAAAPDHWRREWDAPDTLEEQARLRYRRWAEWRDHPPEWHRLEGRWPRDLLEDPALQIRLIVNPLEHERETTLDEWRTNELAKDQERLQGLSASERAARQEFWTKFDHEYFRYPSVADLITSMLIWRVDWEHRRLNDFEDAHPAATFFIARELGAVSPQFDWSVNLVIVELSHAFSGKFRARQILAAGVVGLVSWVFIWFTGLLALTLVLAMLTPLRVVLATPVVTARMVLKATAVVYAPLLWISIAPLRGFPSPAEFLQDSINSTKAIVARRFSQLSTLILLVWVSMAVAIVSVPLLQPLQLRLPCPIYTLYPWHVTSALGAACTFGIWAIAHRSLYKAERSPGPTPRISSLAAPVVLTLYRILCLLAIYNVTCGLYTAWIIVTNIRLPVFDAVFFPWRR